jgi:hypothetical protein
MVSGTCPVLFWLAGSFKTVPDARGRSGGPGVILFVIRIPIILLRFDPETSLGHPS